MHCKELTVNLCPPQFFPSFSPSMSFFIFPFHFLNVNSSLFNIEKRLLTFSGDISQLTMEGSVSSIFDLTPFFAYVA